MVRLVEVQGEQLVQFADEAGDELRIGGGLVVRNGVRRCADARSLYVEADGAFPWSRRRCVSWSSVSPMCLSTPWLPWMPS
ncbi:hypothetical protein ADZ36_03025 [Streptomyces fradiae]|uniref:Uncharacterized protein n=2 Tax=Streptomyces TaxID=1883 RepID=A0A3R7FMX6_9ACTN|nr:hypothetical protein ADZ36_03025 [Streptomyces fradiae]OFA47724.1 hypothetical protein BEN35_20390 [Streptomyces fradiae]PQM23849.1 hypothetical protein Sfr7A_09650 [Streptomyces xinghaiensis]RKM92040.1 hypothetical protein SFRA_026770 [Streptomyces xinghaiensis]RNC73541.1 hypothetical protein DC095_015770 [Streptomyces xinghaiensis]